MSFDQLLVAVCVFAAGAYLARRQWRALRRPAAANSCGGGCGCAKGPKVSPGRQA